MEALPVGLWLHRAAPRVACIASVCTGAFVLARARLLDGKKVVTHWAACEQLQAEFPSLSVKQDAIYFRDGLAGPQPESQPGSIWRWRWSKRI
jgi:transcriptional regulator GlxA family with amidase domain